MITEDSIIPDDFKIVMTDASTKAFFGIAQPVIQSASFVFIVESDATYKVSYQLGGKVLLTEEIVVEPGTT